MKSLLYVGDVTPGTTSEMRSRALAQLGFSVSGAADASRPAAGWLAEKMDSLRFRLRVPRDPNGDNSRILTAAASADVVWIDKGNHIRPATLRAVTRAARPPLIIGYSADDMAARHNTSIWFVQGLGFYDGFITTKSYGVAELTAMGCRRVAFVDNAFDPATHRPMPMDDPATRRFACDVGFVGSYEEERAGLIEKLALAGIPVTIRGNGWEPLLKRRVPGITISPAVYGDEYARCVSATKINLSFLRKMNRDLQTTRSVEIPACGGFMLAERTAEHRRLFQEGLEAEFFSDGGELLDKVRRYLADEPQRLRVATAGRTRCVGDDYSYAARLRAGLESLGLRERDPLAASAASLSGQHHG